MKVLLTGATGFLGGVLSKKLKEKGFKLFSVARSEPSEALTRLSDSIFRGDLSDSDFVDKCLKAGIDAVIHTAAKPGVWGPYDDYYNSNVTSTSNIVTACKKYGAKYLVFTSSPSVVFDMENQKGANETAPYPADYKSPYPKTKAIAEQLVLKANCSSLKTIALRPHLIWGPGDRHLFPRLAKRTKNGKMMLINGGKNIVDTIYVDNAADAHILALEKLSSGAACEGKSYFVTNDEPMATKDIMNSMLKQVGLPPITKNIPEPLAYLAGGAMELFYSAAGIKEEPLLTRFVVRELACDHWFDISAAKKELGYSPKISIAEGLERLGEWAKKENIV